MQRFRLFNLILLLTAMLVWVGCEVDQPTEAVPETVGEGADFTTVVAIGNSLTAGVQDGYLTGENQLVSYPTLIARQMGKSVGEDAGSDFVVPYVTPGAGTQLTLTGFDNQGNPILSRTPRVGGPRNGSYPQPYNNLGVPGALAVDVLQATNAASSASGTNLSFDLILRNQLLNIGTQLQQAIALNPTFVILWIGNNDVLGAATTGNTTPGLPTSPANFRVIMENIFGGLRMANPDITGVVATIPDVLSIPFVTTVPYRVEVPNVGLVPLVIQKGDGSVGQATAGDRILLPASSVIGDVSGTYGPPGVPVGLDASAPLPNSLVLDAAELQTISSAVDGYNDIIKDLAQQNNFALVDAYELLNEAASAEGIEIGGVTFSSAYITGGAFSLDGVHPTTLGYGVVANAFIKAINAHYGSSIPQFNIREFFSPQP